MRTEKRKLRTETKVIRRKGKLYIIQKPKKKRKLSFTFLRYIEIQNQLNKSKP